MLIHLLPGLLLFSILLLPIFPVEGGRISLDFSGVQTEENLERLFHHAILSKVRPLATDRFTIKLNEKAMKNMPFLHNISEIQVSYEGPNHNSSLIQDTQRLLEKASLSLSPASQDLLAILLNKELQIPIQIIPHDDAEVDETLRLFDAFRAYWAMVDQVTTMQIEQMNSLSAPAAVEKYLSKIKETVKDFNSRSNSGRGLDEEEVPFKPSKSHLKELITFVFSRIRNHDVSPLDKMAIEVFMTRKFEEYGLMVLNHQFSGHESEFVYGKTISGNNIIGVLPGILWGTSEDRPVILGAHYDTMPSTPGVIDNGSGTATVLEVARLLTTSGCVFQNSLFFIAFDLEEIGTQGSMMFVKDFLYKFLLPTYGISTISGAFIMDCLGNWVSSPNSQTLPETWSTQLPGLTFKLHAQNNTGDFLALMYRANHDSVLSDTFARYYSHLGQSKYRLERMAAEQLGPTTPDEKVILDHIDFIRSDHLRFWYTFNQDLNVTLPAVLITDTGPYRGKMHQCYHLECDAIGQISVDFGFLIKIVEATAWATADLANGMCDKDKSIRKLFNVTKYNKEKSDTNDILTQIDLLSDLQSSFNKNDLTGTIEKLQFLGISNPFIDDKSFIASNNKSNNAAISKQVNIQLIHDNQSENKPAEIFNDPSQFNLRIRGENSSLLIPIYLLKHIQLKPHNEAIKNENLLPSTINTSPVNTVAFSSLQPSTVISTVKNLNTNNTLNYFNLGRSSEIDILPVLTTTVLNNASPTFNLAALSEPVEKSATVVPVSSFTSPTTILLSNAQSQATLPIVHTHTVDTNIHPFISATPTLILENSTVIKNISSSIVPTSLLLTNAMSTKNFKTKEPAEISMPSIMEFLERHNSPHRLALGRSLNGNKSLEQFTDTVSAQVHVT